MSQQFTDEKDTHTKCCIWCHAQHISLRKALENKELLFYNYQIGKYQKAGRYQVQTGIWGLGKLHVTNCQGNCTWGDHYTWCDHDREHSGITEVEGCIGLAHDPTIPLLYVSPIEILSQILKATWTGMPIGTLFVEASGLGWGCPNKAGPWHWSPCGQVHLSQGHMSKKRTKCEGVPRAHKRGLGKRPPYRYRVTRSRRKMLRVVRRQPQGPWVRSR